MAAAVTTIRVADCTNLLRYVPVAVPVAYFLLPVDSRVLYPCSRAPNCLYIVSSSSNRTFFACISLRPARIPPRLPARSLIFTENVFRVYAMFFLPAPRLFQFVVFFNTRSSSEIQQKWESEVQQEGAKKKLRKLM